MPIKLPSVLGSGKSADDPFKRSPPRPSLSPPPPPPPPPFPFECAVFVKFNIEVKGEHMKQLYPKGHLGEAIVDFYMKLLQRRDDRRVAESQPPGSLAGCQFFNSLFLGKLMNAQELNNAWFASGSRGYDYDGVARYTKHINIFEKTHLFFPVHITSPCEHWCMAVVHMDNCHIEYFDSMGGSGDKYLEVALSSLWSDDDSNYLTKKICTYFALFADSAQSSPNRHGGARGGGGGQVLRRWLIDEMAKKKPTNLQGGWDPAHFKLVSTSRETPCQDDRTDGGVFSVMCADFLSENLRFTFSQSDIPHFRLRIANSILEACLDGRNAEDEELLRAREAWMSRCANDAGGDDEGAVPGGAGASKGQVQEGAGSSAQLVTLPVDLSISQSELRSSGRVTEAETCEAQVFCEGIGNVEAAIARRRAPLTDAQLLRVNEALYQTPGQTIVTNEVAAIYARKGLCAHVSGFSILPRRTTSRRGSWCVCARTCACRATPCAARRPPCCFRVQYRGKGRAHGAAAAARMARRRDCQHLHEAPAGFLASHRAASVFLWDCVVKCALRRIECMKPCMLRGVACTAWMGECALYDLACLVCASRVGAIGFVPRLCACAVRRQKRDKRLVAVANPAGSVKGCHFFNSFFVDKLLDDGRGYNYRNVRRWTKRIDVFSMKKLFFPVNIDNQHWCMAVVHMDDRRIQFYDSYGGSGRGWLQVARRAVMLRKIARANKQASACGCRSRARRLLENVTRFSDARGGRTRVRVCGCGACFTCSRGRRWAVGWSTRWRTRSRRTCRRGSTRRRSSPSRRRATRLDRRIAMTAACSRSCALTFFRRASGSSSHSVTCRISACAPPTPSLRNESSQRMMPNPSPPSLLASK